MVFTLNFSLCSKKFIMVSGLKQSGREAAFDPRDPGSNPG